MKSLNMYLGSVIDNDDVHFESLLDDDDYFYGVEHDKKVIENWIESNYDFRGKLSISDDFVVDCSGDVYIRNKTITSLTNGLFRWGRVGRDFYCYGCEKLTSLKGSPKEIGNNFSCGNCGNLKTLEGAPEKVGGGFHCIGCEKLTSLEGAPEEVDGGFWCGHCGELKTLEGAPKKVGGYFYCNNCKKLKITDSDRKKYKIEY